MTDINTYANDLLLEFLDACHDEIRSVLRVEFGDHWLQKGIERHLNRTALDRTRAMLDSPMAIIDMNKTDDELYGVEHLSSIVLGNWTLFKSAFDKRNSTQVYFGEIAELRHNVSHRRQHHMLSKSELLRFVYNARLLLSAFGSPAASKFESIAIGLEQGGVPWGSQLIGTLPPANKIVSDFVGRETELRKLSMWLTSADLNQLVIWGYGGSGKSALAYQFARAVRDGAPRPLEAVVWLSAKRREFVGGETRDRAADFDSVETFGRAFWNALYGTEPSIAEEEPRQIIRELNETPLLLIIDDIDSVLENVELTRFLLQELYRSHSMILYTSRQRMHGQETIEVLGFSQEELTSFVRSRAREYRLDVKQCLHRLRAVHSVTGGFPLFVDDLLRHAMFGGLDDAINEWSQRKGDQAREYSLRRQLSSLGEAGQRVLIATAVASRSVSKYEMVNICGFPDEDVQHAIRNLLNWRLLNGFERDAKGHATFSCNSNTRRLVEKTYGREPMWEAYRESFQNFVGSVKPPALRRAVAIAISEAKAAVLRGDLIGAEERIRSKMTGELANNADLWGVLGWVLSRHSESEHLTSAREAFSRAHRLGSQKEDLYHHWKELERELAEELALSADNEESLAQWREAARVIGLGIERCGDTPTLCGGLAYLRTREAKTLQHLNQFTSARNCFAQGAKWARRALSAPNPSSSEVNRSQIYRSLVIALEGFGDPEQTIKALDEWKSFVDDDDLYWVREHDRLASVPSYKAYLPL